MLDATATFTRTEVTARGFEAMCVGNDGARYLWHGDCGLRVDASTRSTMLITDPAVLPDGPWLATPLGEEELRDPELLASWAQRGEWRERRDSNPRPPA